jgi:hypothetical protein
MEPWYWRMQIDHYHRMQIACIAHGDTEGAKIFRQGEESARQWLGQQQELRQSREVCTRTRNA